MTYEQNLFWKKVVFSSLTNGADGNRTGATLSAESVGSSLQGGHENAKANLLVLLQDTDGKNISYNII